MITQINSNKYSSLFLQNRTTHAMIGMAWRRYDEIFPFFFFLFRTHDVYSRWSLNIIFSLFFPPVYYDKMNGIQRNTGRIQLTLQNKTKTIIDDDVLYTQNNLPLCFLSWIFILQPLWYGHGSLSPISSSFFFFIMGFKGYHGRIALTV